jgi:hypothetical protein
MKITRDEYQQGGTLVITLVCSVLIGSALCSHLVLVAHRNITVMRGTAWNTAIPVLEAGIEEALTHLQSDSNNPTGNNWTPAVLNGETVYWKRRDLPDGSHFLVTNCNITSPTPVIYSAGFVKAPLRDGEYISRLVRVTATNPPSQFNVAIAANGLVRLSGSAVVDGYNSALGTYSPTNNRNADGGVATNSKQTPAIDVGSGHIYGYAVTGPGGTVAVNGGSVGDLTQTSGIQTGWVNNNMNVQFQPNSPPSGTFFQLVQGVGTNVLTTGTYKMDNFSSMDKTRPMIITGDVTLWVTGNINVSGSGYVRIEPNASLNLYVGTTDTTTPSVMSVSGGSLVNATGSPKNFHYYGLPSNTTLNYNGQSDFVGTVNAPQAAFTISGNASLYGAVICDSFNSNGGSNVHYDQALRGGGFFMITSWKEL